MRNVPQRRQRCASPLRVHFASPVVVDRGNSLSRSSRSFARFAVEHGYRVHFREPDSTWWREIRVLLADKEHTWPLLWEWAHTLARMNARTHRVPARTIYRRMTRWIPGLTVDDVLAYDPDARVGQS